MCLDLAPSLVVKQEILSDTVILWISAQRTCIDSINCKIIGVWSLRGAVSFHQANCGLKDKAFTSACLVDL